MAEKLDAFPQTAQRSAYPLDNWLKTLTPTPEPARSAEVLLPRCAKRPAYLPLTHFPKAFAPPPYFCLNAPSPQNSCSALQNLAAFR
jgi:hypothetical protein